MLGLILFLPSCLAAPWVDLQAYEELLGFVHILNEAVVGKKVTDTFPSYPVSVVND